MYFFFIYFVAGSKEFLLKRDVQIVENARIQKMSMTSEFKLKSLVKLKYLSYFKTMGLSTISKVTQPS